MQTYHFAEKSLKIVLQSIHSHVSRTIHLPFFRLLLKVSPIRRAYVLYQMEPFRMESTGSGFFELAGLTDMRGVVGRDRANVMWTQYILLCAPLACRVSTKFWISFGCPYRVEVKTQLNHSVVIGIVLGSCAGRAAFLCLSVAHWRCCARGLLLPLHCSIVCILELFSSLSRYFAFVCVRGCVSCDPAALYRSNEESFVI